MEIERKWLVEKDKIPYDLEKLESHRIEQRYISISPTVRIRKIDNNEFILTIKTKPTEFEENFVRNEVEIDLKENDYLALRDISKGRTIDKTRYIHPIENGLKEEIDVFHEELEGLCYLEIEFPDVETAQLFEMPQWVKKEVTEDARYTNASLSYAENSLEELMG